MTSSPTTSSPREGRRKPANKAFTIDHFRRYAERLVLDTGECWPVQDFQLEIAESFFEEYREIWAIIPEGNAKTTLFAGIALYGADFARSPWIPIAASSREQAEIMFGQAQNFVENTPGLNKRFRVYEGYRKIKSLRNGGKGIKVYAADQGTADGIIPFPFALVDEGHRHKDLGLYRTWKGKLNKRRAKIGLISTAGEPGTDFETTRDAIRDAATVRRREGAYLRAEGGGVCLHEFKVPDIDQARDLEMVKSANPLPTVMIADLAEKIASPTLDYGEDWLRRTCNIASRSKFAAITDEEWDAAATDIEIPVGESVDVGLDIAWKHDCTGIVPLWVKSFSERFFGKPHILTPPRDGSMMESRLIKEAFEEINERNPIGIVVMDREKGETIAEWLMDELGVIVVDRGRTNEPASEDYERFMEGVRERWIKHDGDPTLRQHAMNAVAKNLNGDRKRFDRPSDSRRNPREQDRRVIDGLDAASMVHTVAVAELREESPADWYARNRIGVV
jgi:phage terminase large subunit-like protein